MVCTSPSGLLPCYSNYVPGAKNGPAAGVIEAYIQNTVRLHIKFKGMKQTIIC